MHIFKTKPEILTNFPDDYPKYKRIATNILFNIAGTIIFPRKNLLTKKDIKGIQDSIQRGDLLLLGNLRTIFSSFLPAPITHIAIAINKKKILHSTTKGVETLHMKEIYTNYDTAIILRINTSKEKITKALKYGYTKKGKAYNFYFEEKGDGIFCSAFINECLQHAKINTKLSNFNRDIELFSGYKLKTIKKNDIEAALKPSDFIKGNFKEVFHSHNIYIKKEKIIFLELDKNLDAFISNFEIKTNSEAVKKARKLRKEITSKLITDIINNHIKE